jgi:uncharacterized protein (TIGR00725 family)
MKKIGIIGPGESLCSHELYDFGINLGKAIAGKDRVIICGGLGGFMEAVCKGVKRSKETFSGQTIGILPGEHAGVANPFIDIAIPSGMGIARNALIIRSADIIIAAGGGAGTLSELAMAWQLDKPVLCVTIFEGWAKSLAGKSPDKLKKGLFYPVSGIFEILNKINEI